jgi:RHS repeat-associated protein
MASVWMALCVVALLGCGESSARADVLVGGAHQSDEPLVIAPEAGATSTYHSTSYDPKVAVIQRMPSTKTIDAVTIGDIGQSAGCGAYPFDLDIRESTTGRYADSTVVVSTDSSGSQTLPVVPGKVTWPLPSATTLTAGRSYWVELRSGVTGCASSFVQTTWDLEQQPGGLESGPGPCEWVTSTYGAGYYRVWHEAGQDDWTCPAPDRPDTGFDPSMPTGWLFTSGNRPLLEHRLGGWIWQSQCYLGSTGAYWKPEDTPFQGGSVWACVLADFADPGTQTDEGWFHGFDGNGDQRAVYLGLHTVGWSGPPTHWDTYGTATQNWDAPQDPELSGTDNPAEPNVHGCKAADPVDCATGNLTETATDVSLTGRGVPLAISRTYNALDAASSTGPGSFGYGWSAAFAQRLEVDGDGRAIVHQANGSTAMFWPDGTGGYVAPARVQATLVAVDGGGWDFTLPDGTVERFDGAGHATRITSPSGQVTAISYDADGHLSAITDPGGRELPVQTNEDGTVSQITTLAGRHVDYAYTDGNLTSVTDLTGQAWTYAYDARHRLTSVTDPRGHTVTNVFDDSDRVIEQHQPGGRDWQWAYDGATTTITDPRGTVTKQRFDANRLVGLTRAVGTPLEATTTFDYDADGNPTVRHNPDGTQTSSTWTSRGDLASSTDADGNTTHYEWNDHHRMTAVVLPSGRRTEMSYDDAGRLTEIRRHDDEANATRTQRFTWDGALLASRTDALSRTTTFSYDAAGDRTAITTPAGRVTSYGYDDDGYRTSTVSPRGNEPGASQADYRTAFTTDDLGRVTSVTDPLGHVTQTHYDAVGNVDSTTDAAGKMTQISYDANDEPTTVTRPDGHTTQTTYDAAGAVASQTDAAGKTVSFERDALGRLAQRTDPLDRHTTYAYDDLGRLTSSTDAAGHQTSYTYDNAGRLTAVHYAAGDPGDTSYDYDVDGRRTSMTDDSGQTTYDYDSLGRVSAVHNGHGKTVSYGYDAASQLTRIGYPQTAAGQGGDVTRAYTDDGLLASVTDFDGHTTSFGYDADANHTTTTFPAASGNVDQATFDAAGQVTDITAKHDSTTLADFAYARDQLGRVTQSTSTGISGDASHDYTYDDLGQLTSDGAQSYGYTTNGSITTLDGADGGTYDDARQLDTLNVAGQQSTYHYDALGQRTSSQTPGGQATTYDYDNAGHLAAIQSTDAGVDDHYAYDGDGLRTSRTSGDSTVYYTWDTASAGLPLLLADHDTQYIYGPDDLPMEQINADGTVTYLHHDQLGSTRLITTATGDVAGTATYSPYGAPAAHSGATSALGYGGQYTDPNSGLIYLRHRYYDPSTAQFITRDPLEALTGQPYSYAGDDPINSSDPSGLSGIFGTGVGPDVSVGDMVHAGLDVAAVPPYLLYYVSNQRAAGLNSVGSQLGAPGSAVSHVLALPLVVPQALGLGTDAGIDWIKGQTVSNESICDEGKVGYINPLHQWLPGPLKGPQIYLPGIHANGSVDFQW